MTFLNAALLGGMAAFAIPVIIHLFHRTRFRVVRWGAMHLLESVLRKNTRRLKLEQLILLLIRCLIPVILALLMARPVLTGLEPLLGKQPTSTILLLDNSYSMEAGGVNQSNFMKAKTAAREILDGHVDGSDVAVVRMAGGVSILLDEPSLDLERLRGELDKARAGFGAADLPEALDTAAVLIPKLGRVHREVVIMSDFQKVSWGHHEAPMRVNFFDTIRESHPFKPKLTLFQIGGEITDNVSVTKIDFSRKALGVDQQLRVRATLRNHGGEAYPDLRVVFRVDGADKDVTQTTLEPESDRDVLFTHRFTTSGSHTVEVYADADLLKADNGMMRSVAVWDQVPVLLVSGDANPEFLRGETDFAEIALRPFGAAKEELADLISTRVVEAPKLDVKMLSEARVVLLANVRRLEDAQLKSLESFVREGGGLLIFPGNRIDARWYNATLAADGRGLLPLRVASLAGNVNPGGSHASIVRQHYDHDALTMFNDPRNGNLSTAQIRLWYKMRPQEGSGDDADVTILARLDTGDPFLAEKAFGEGRSILACVPCDAEWTNLPLRPFYLPLLQQLVTYLASEAEPPRNVEVGEPLVALLPPSMAGREAKVTDPAGKVHLLKIEAKGTSAVAEFAHTQQPGLYVLKPAGGDDVHFVVNTDRRESDLGRLTDDEIGTVAEQMGATLVTSTSEYRDLQNERRFGREVWTILLTAMLGLIFLEMFLEQAFARRKA